MLQHIRVEPCIDELPTHWHKVGVGGSSPLIPTKYTIYLFIIFIGVGNMQTKSDVFVMIKKEQYEKNKKN